MATKALRNGVISSTEPPPRRSARLGSKTPSAPASPAKPPRPSSRPPRGVSVDVVPEARTLQLSPSPARPRKTDLSIVIEDDDDDDEDDDDDDDDKDDDDDGLELEPLQIRHHSRLPSDDSASVRSEGSGITNAEIAELRSNYATLRRTLPDLYEFSQITLNAQRKFPSPTEAQLDALSAEFEQDEKSAVKDFLDAFNSFAPDSPYIRPDIVERAIFDTNQDRDPFNDPWSLWDVLQLANLAKILLDLLITKAGVGRTVYLETLCNNFSRAFPSTQDSDPPQTTSTFRALLALRTQLVIASLHEQHNTKGHYKDPDVMLSDVLVTNLTAYDNDPLLSEILAEQTQNIRNHFREDPASTINNDSVDFDGLDNAFPWSMCMIELWRWISMRRRSLNMRIANKQGFDEILSAVDLRVEELDMQQDTGGEGAREEDVVEAQNEQQTIDNQRKEILRLQAVLESERLARTGRSSPGPGRLDAQPIDDSNVVPEEDVDMENRDPRRVIATLKRKNRKEFPRPPASANLRSTQTAIRSSNEEGQRVPSFQPGQGARVNPEAPPALSKKRSLMDRQEDATKVPDIEIDDIYQPEDEPESESAFQTQQDDSRHLRHNPNPNFLPPSKRAKNNGFRAPPTQSTQASRPLVSRTRATVEDLDYEAAGDLSAPSPTRSPAKSAARSTTNSPRKRLRQGSRRPRAAPTSTRNMADDEELSRAGTPPASNYSRVNEDAKITTMAAKMKSRPMPQVRVGWSMEETDAFIHYIEIRGWSASDIKKYDETRGGNVLARRSQVNLKDKARNLKVDYLKSGHELPVNFDLIPLSQPQWNNLADFGVRRTKAIDAQMKEDTVEELDDEIE